MANSTESGSSPQSTGDPNLEEDGIIDLVNRSRTGDASQENEQADRLRALGADVQEQDDLERNINRQADQLLTEQANERDQKRLEKTKAEKDKLQSQIRKITSKLNQPVLPPVSTVVRLQNEVDHYHSQIEILDRDIADIEGRMKERDGDLDELENDTSQGGRLPGESQRNFLIRTGKITPFSNFAQPTARVSANLRETLLDAEQDKPENEQVPDDEMLRKDERSHVHLRRPGFKSGGSSSPIPEDTDEATPPPSKRRKVDPKRAKASASRAQREIKTENESATSEFEPDGDGESPEAWNIDTSDAEEDDAFQPELAIKKRKSSSRRQTKRSTHQFSDVSEVESDRVDDLAGIDDGNEDVYKKRLVKWISGRSSARNKARARQDNPVDLPDDEEWHLPHPDEPDLDLGGGYKLPGDVHPALFDYQKTGVQWLSELYRQEVGGIVGDEMGLGKTIQIISFLAGLHYSKKITQPIIIVCPATVMKQWVNEFHTWWPAFRVSILHSSGSGMIDVGRESREENAMLERTAMLSMNNTHLTKAEKAAQKIVSRVVREGHVLVTTYAGLQNYAEFLIPIDWEYAVLDEGHKIRNPNASITIHCKELRTANRIILSGTPIQNNLVELWSLFDFVYPMRLGTLVNFRNEFEIPIRQGGYANASNLQVMTAAKCAETLKDSIQPYLLQRLKVDVASDLPKKTEQVLFCKLTEAQRRAYTRFLQSDEMKSIEAGRRQMLFGIDILRKICNHPDLAEHKVLKKMRDYNYGEPKASGKMLVVKELLDIWSKGGHKTLLFCQNRIMLDILQTYVESMSGMRYRRMDGTTAIKERQTLVDEFNRDPNLHVFLLTTKVGGLGVNLTGADRVIIFDPDWNPSTDMQARERAWRLGQKREVQIFRLMMAGTIEEKIFHRQIFKQFLTNKILKDPKQRQTFQMKDLHDLFTLGDEYKDGTETGKMFKGTETHINDTSKSSSVEDSSRRDPSMKDEFPAVEEKPQNLLVLDGVSSIQNGEQVDGADAGEDGEGKDAEQRLLTGIFARSGVASTVEHDRIVNGRIEYAPDREMLQRAADKVAAEAAKSLREAEKLAKQTPIGVPTWTGEQGSAGRPPSPPPPPPARRTIGRNIGGSRSASILSNLRERDRNTGPSSSTSTPINNLSRSSTPQSSSSTLPTNPRQRRRNGRSSASSSSTAGPTAAQFGSMIVDFLRANNGSVVTQMMIDHFGHMCKTDRHSAEFKAMLKQIATLSKGRGGRGVWSIREEYRK